MHWKRVTRSLLKTYQHRNIEEVEKSQSSDDDDMTKRPKARTINAIVRTLVKWRHLYHGVYEMQEGNEDERVLVKYSLADAATKLGMSKKSLDDYLM